MAERAKILTEAPRFSHVVIGATGKMAVMHTISPATFVEFKRWLAERPNREPSKRRRDALQAQTVQGAHGRGFVAGALKLKPPLTDGHANHPRAAPQQAAQTRHNKGAPLIDPTDWFDTPKSIVLAVLRVLWWLAWDFCVQTVGWSIGWCVLRVLTLGRYPEERLGEVDEAGTYTAFVVEVVGLVAGIWGLAGAWP